MSTFRQGANPWFRFGDPPGWKARAIAPEAIETAMRWTGAEPPTTSRPMQSTREESGIDFVRQAIQRSYQ